MEKVLGTRQNQQFGSGFQVVYPVQSLLHVDQLVLVALDDQPPTVRLPSQPGSKASSGRRNGDQAVNLDGRRRTDRDGSAKRKTREPKWAGVVSVL